MTRIWLIFILFCAGCGGGTGENAFDPLDTEGEAVALAGVWSGALDSGTDPASHDGVFLFSSPHGEIRLIDWTCMKQHVGFAGSLTTYDLLNGVTRSMIEGTYNVQLSSQTASGSVLTGGESADFTLTAQNCSQAAFSDIAGNWITNIARQPAVMEISANGRIRAHGEEGCEISGAVAPYDGTPVYRMILTLGTGCGEFKAEYKGLAVRCGNLSFALSDGRQALQWVNSRILKTDQNRVQIE